MKIIQSTKPEKVETTDIVEKVDPRQEFAKFIERQRRATLVTSPTAKVQLELKREKYARLKAHAILMDIKLNELLAGAVDELLPGLESIAPR